MATHVLGSTLASLYITFNIKYFFISYLFAFIWGLYLNFVRNVRTDKKLVFCKEIIF
jgi:hypothetical protein